MGYRSEVVVSIPKDLFKTVVPLIKDAMEFADDVTYSKDREAYYVRWDSIKWYDSYPEIEAVENVVSEYEDIGFIRLGEELEDMEIKNTRRYDLYAVRTVTIPDDCEDVDVESEIKKEE
jgi:hypothetical protein